MLPGLRGRTLRRGGAAIVAEHARSADVALPESAGLVFLADHLPPEPAAVLRDKHRLALPHVDVRGPAPLGCYKVEPAEQRTLFSRLLSCGAAVLLPSDEVATLRGRPLVGGMFAFPKAKKGVTAQRLIIDRRPQNFTEKRFHWLELPSAAQLQRIVLDEAEVLLGSGEDLECYYYFFFS